MRLTRHVSLRESPLRHYATRPLPPALASRRIRSRYSHSITSSAYPERIAVLGGGVAGLSSAYFVSREFPQSKITVFEAGKDAGGWLKSKKVAVPGGEVLFEQGPRTLRNATVTAHLCQELGIVDDITYTRRDAPAAQNRYIYYPDRLNQLPTKIPSPSEFLALWRSGILRGAIIGIPREPFVRKREDAITDETIGSFLTRRVHRRLADNVVSAVFHGIYAGDIWRLSAKTLLPQAWHLEGRYGSALGGFYTLQKESGRPLEQQLDEKTMSVDQHVLAHPMAIESAQAMNDEFDIEEDFVSKMQNASTFTFKNGLQHLITSLQKAVAKRGNVEIKVNCPVQSHAPVGNNGRGVVVTTGHPDSTTTQTFDLAISTLRNPALTPYVTVQTVNLYYSTPNLHPYQGFGYLIPQSVPFEQNPERALGVIFDSSATSGQDSVDGTKLTVMLGGHWWDGWANYPDEEEALDMAKSVLARHLNISAEPTASHVHLSRDCIPQYTLGYQDRLTSYHEQISQDFKGRLRLVGNQVNGVGVNDVIQGSWNLARDLSDDGWKDGGGTGLERGTDTSPWEMVGITQLEYAKIVGS
ncbi:hypothetical protein BDU57DRAFT_440344 [Ampelomyces quisqualis]|uniref:Protoporphyrinogen oxidase n=1 Tax=Ampelomyces quisqualis TaxID=50730 RepID=A0A6A5QWQ7_AMPQU|nr:hypothetical protein BDU57DRAFT_440344 [Ampelomyces quisqualis]